MSRSYRRHPFRGITTCPSEKEDKQFAHRAYRHTIRQRLLAARHLFCLPVDFALGVMCDDVGADLPHWREFSDPWSWGKDGRWRFDPTRYPTLMRK